MRIQYKYLLWINGVLALIWSVYIVTDSIRDRGDMLRLEAESLQCLARTLRDAGFSRAAPSPALDELVTAVAGAQSGTEVMVLDRDSRVVASSVAGRKGKRWRERDIDQVLQEDRAATWQHEGHFHGGREMLDVTVPVRGAGGHPAYAIHIARRMDLVRELLTEHQTRNVLWTLGSMLLIGVALSLVTYRWLIRPVGQISGTLAGTHWYQPRQHAGDELQRLAQAVPQLVQDAEGAMQEKDRLLAQVRSFNDKLEQEIRNVREELTATQAELVRSERLSAVGALASALAHELRNPLHIIRGDAELLARREDNQETCADILEEVDRINRFVNELLDYTRPIARSSASAEVPEVLRGAVDAVARTQPTSGVEVALDSGPEVELEMDPDHLRQIVINLVSNALDAMPRGGELSVRAARANGKVRLEVQDTGIGIDPADQARLFEPFFTRRPAGTGLGLAVVKRLVDLYDGEVAVSSAPGEGTRVTLSFDATSSTPESDHGANPGRG